MALVHTALSDFVLFPREQSFFDMSDQYQDDSFIHPTYGMSQTFPQDLTDLEGSDYPMRRPTTSFTTNQMSSHGMPHLVVEAPEKAAKYSIQRYTPSASPSTSTSQSLDHAPSIMSSTSCASIQSTASSAVGSPYSHPTHSQDQWMDPPHGLCIAPNITQNDVFGSDTFSLSGFDNDQVAFEHDKFSGNFVGELQQVSSTFSPISHVMQSPFSSAPASHSLVSTTPPSHSLALDKSAGTAGITIDTILEEANSANGTRKPSDLISPRSAAPAVNPSPISKQPIHFARSPRQNPRHYNSPITPASARSPSVSRVPSPFPVRRDERRRGSLVDAGTSSTRSSPLISSRPPLSNQQSFATQIPPNNFYGIPFSTPFFGQSSGRFVAPLESSCWFSLCPRPTSFAKGFNL